MNIPKLEFPLLASVSRPNWVNSFSINRLYGYGLPRDLFKTLAPGGKKWTELYVTVVWTDLQHLPSVVMWLPLCKI